MPQLVECGGLRGIEPETLSGFNYNKIRSVAVRQLWFLNQYSLCFIQCWIGTDAYVICYHVHVCESCKSHWSYSNLTYMSEIQCAAISVSK